MVERDELGNSLVGRVKHFSQFAVGYFGRASGVSETRFNVNTSLPEVEYPDPLSGRQGLELPGVNQSGRLLQRIPIIVPGGYERLSPRLRLTYSGRGNGIMGRHWSVNKDFIVRGVSRTNRSSRGLYYDNEKMCFIMGDRN